MKQKVFGIGIYTGVSEENEPWIGVELGETRGRMNPSQAREHAWDILNAATDAESEAILREALEKESGVPRAAAQLIGEEYRKWSLGRGRNGDAKEDRRVSRAQGAELLMKAELLAAQAFLVEYLTEKVGLPLDMTPMAVATQYRKYYERHYGAKRPARGKM